MLTEKDYCDYDVQKSLMELGFPIVAQSYDLGNELKEYLPKIHLYDAQKWLRNEKKIEVGASSDCMFEHRWYWYIKSLTNTNKDVSVRIYQTYEEALLEGIKEAVKLLKKRK